MNNYNQIFIHQQPVYQKTVNREYSRIISAAVVSQQFRKKLLSDPVKAISSGYCNEKFKITANEMRQIKMIRAKTLEEFADKLSRIENNIFMPVPLIAGDK
jgi:hypothetical protein